MQRQLVGIGEEEPAQPGRGRAQLGVGLDLVEPRRDRPPREVGGDRRIPSLLGQACTAWPTLLELLRQPLPAARRVARDDPRPARSVGADVAEAAAQDARQLQPELAGQLADLVLLLVDHVAAGLGVLPLGEAVADRPDPAADAVARVDDGDGGAGGENRAPPRAPPARRPRPGPKRPRGCGASHHSKAFGQRTAAGLLAVTIGKHGEGEEVQPGIDRLVEGFEHARRVVVAAAALEQGFRFVTAITKYECSM